MPLDWQTVHVPLIGGVKTKQDPRALQPPGLLVCRNAEWDEWGGIRPRRHYASLSANYPASVRRMAVYNNELLLFTKTNLYSWSAAEGDWQLIQEYLAPKVTEQTRFARTEDQIGPDRAELGGVVVYVWTERTSAANFAGYYAAIDKVTGAVLCSPSLALDTIGATVTVEMSAVPLDNNVVAVVFNVDGTLKAGAIDVTNVAAGLGATATLGTLASSNWDVAAGPNGDAYVVLDTAAGYTVGRLTDAMGWTSVNVARPSDYALALATNATHTVVVRSDATTVKADVLSATTLADTANVNVTVGTTPGATTVHMTCAFRSVADSGDYRCYAFWSTVESVLGTATGHVGCNYIAASAGTAGTAVVTARTLGIASHAFDYNGRVYVWLVFAGQSAASGMAQPIGFRAQLQNTYFLYREEAGSYDAHPIAKAVPARAGGFGYMPLPHVQNTATARYVWSGSTRRIINLGSGQSSTTVWNWWENVFGGNKQYDYSDASPHEIVLDFDSNEARRTVQLGRTLYVAGGQILQYDGRGLVEVGFHVYPWYFDASRAATGSSLEGGTYVYKSTYRWSNVQGEFERGTTASTEQIVATAGDTITLASCGLVPTMKSSWLGRTVPAVEFWRSLKNPNTDTPLQLASSQDPANVTNPNRYIRNDLSAALLASFTDTLTDADLSKRERYPETGGVLESLSPPAASVIAASQDRIFLAGIADSPHSVWYSKLRGDGEIVAFHDGLTFAVPQVGGPITALAFLNETLIVFKETAVYAVPGEGYDNAGGGTNYGPARTLAQDVGADNAESVAFIPRGLLFHSAKGWYLIDRGWNLGYVGADVADYDSETVLGVSVIESQHQVRVVTANRILAWDYSEPVNQWSNWPFYETPLGTPLSDGLIWNGQHYVLTGGGPRGQQADWTAPASEPLAYEIDLETAWIKTADLQGYQRIRRIMLLGEYESSHSIRLRAARDYQASYFGDITWAATPTTVGGPEQLRYGPSVQKCEAMKFRITVTGWQGEMLRLTGLGLEVGVKRGLHKGLPAAQKR